MKQAAVALAWLGAGLVRTVDLEGAFLIAGTTLLAVGASFIAPAGPFFVVGGVTLFAGLGLALRSRRP